MIAGQTRPFAGTESCPCGSGRAFRLCCKRYDGAAELRIGPIWPPGPVTGYSNPRCYLAETANCSDKISREHYISKSVLQLVGTERIGGLPWQKEGAVSAFGPDALTARILCERHNNALSPLDSEAKRFFEALREAHADAMGRPRAGRQQWRLASGEAFERWGYKVLAGLIAAKIARREGATVTADEVSAHHKLAGLLSGGALPAVGGLYVGHTTDVIGSLDFALAPLSDGDDVIGLLVEFGFAEFTILLGGGRSAHDRMLASGRMHRPWAANFYTEPTAPNLPQRGSALMLSWPDAPRREFPVLNLPVTALPKDKAEPSD